jgi:hypothetical protein
MATLTCAYCLNHLLSLSLITYLATLPRTDGTLEKEGVGVAPILRSLGEMIMSKSQSIYQLKITLNDSKPPIWRRVLVPKNITLYELHEIIQTVMGWDDYHLHQFTIDSQIYGNPEYDEYGDLETKNEKKYRLDQFVHGDRFKFHYEYDFGDGWLHNLLVEKILPKEKGIDYPVCIKGKRACPPEDVGGVWGYDNFLEAIADPTHEEHDSYLEWIGGEFDPAAFDLDGVNERLRRPYNQRDEGQLVYAPSQAAGEEILEKIATYVNELDEEQLSRIESLAVRRDLVTFLSYLQENRVVGTQATGNLPLKAVREICTKFVNPPILDSKIGTRVYKLRSEDDVWQLFFLHMLAHTGGLITGGQSRTWKITPDGEAFLITAAPLQLGFMLDTWWKYADWRIAFPFSGLDQGLPLGFAKITLRQLLGLSVDKEVSSDAFADKLISETGFQWPSQEGDTSKGIRRSAIERMVILPMMEFGCLEAEHSVEKIGRTEIKNISSIRLTQLGEGLLGTL